VGEVTRRVEDGSSRNAAVGFTGAARYAATAAVSRSTSTSVVRSLCTRQGCRGYGDSHGDSHGYGDGYGDCDESPWACGNSVGIFDWVEIKRKWVKYATNHSWCLNFAEQSRVLNLFYKFVNFSCIIITEYRQ